MPDSVVNYAPIRPPTEAYRDRVAAAAWREKELPATIWSEPSMRIVNLEGAYWFELGALSEIILPVVAGIRAGSYGKFALGIATTDEPVVSWVRAVAAETGAPLFLTRSVGERPQAVRVSSALTPAEADTLDAVLSAGGTATAADVARTRDFDQTAASNRLANLEKKRFLFRVARTRPQADLFVDPASTAGPSLQPALEIRSAEVNIPDEIREAVFALSAQLGRDPSDLLAEAWKAYFVEHRDELNDDIRKAQERLKRDVEDEGDTEGLDQWAIDAASRIRG
jgi:hypothetical protein